MRVEYIIVILLVLIIFMIGYSRMNRQMMKKKMGDDKIVIDSPFYHPIWYRYPYRYPYRYYSGYRGSGHGHRPYRGRRGHYGRR